MERVENGRYISVDYIGKLGDGQIFDTSEGRQPLEVHIGAGQVIKGFEDQLMGMALNEKKVFVLPPDEAYGPRNEELIHSVPRSEVPPDVDLQIGMIIGLTTPKGNHVPARITHLDDQKVIMDLNHPLAGESLTFEIEVVGISNTPTQESADCDCGGDCSSGCNS